MKLNKPQITDTQTELESYVADLLFDKEKASQPKKNLSVPQSKTRRSENISIDGKVSALTSQELVESNLKENLNIVEENDKVTHLYEDRASSIESAASRLSSFERPERESNKLPSDIIPLNSDGSSEISNDQKFSKKQAEQEKTERKQAEREQAEREQAEREQAEREQAEREQAEREQAEREQAEREKAEREQAEREQAEREQAEREQAEREQAEREQAEREQAEREKIEIELVAKEKLEQAIASERAEEERAARKMEEFRAKEQQERKLSNDKERAKTRDNKDNKRDLRAESNHLAQIKKENAKYQERDFKQEPETDTRLKGVEKLLAKMARADIAPKEKVDVELKTSTEKQSETHYSELEQQDSSAQLEVVKSSFEHRESGPLKDSLGNVFQTLVFEVSRLPLAVPLVKLGGIVNISDVEVTPLVGTPDWFIGLVPNERGNLMVVDTQKFLMPEKEASKEDTYDYLIVLDDTQWALACHSVGDAKNLTPDDIRWSARSSKRPWFAGMVVEYMSALLEVDSLINMLAENVVE
jgi:chemotaxis signal transduction protein